MSCGPTAAELSQIRADVAALLDLDCTIQRKAPTKDAWGSEMKNWVTISPADLKAGMKTPKLAVLQAYADLIGANLAWQVNLPYGTDVAIQDHIIIGSDTMVVQANLSPQSYNSLTTVLACEVQQP